MTKTRPREYLKKLLPIPSVVGWSPAMDRVELFLEDKCTLLELPVYCMVSTWLTITLFCIPHMKKWWALCLGVMLCWEKLFTTFYGLNDWLLDAIFKFLIDWWMFYLCYLYCYSSLSFEICFHSQGHNCFCLSAEVCNFWSFSSMWSLKKFTCIYATAIPKKFEFVLFKFYSLQCYTFYTASFLLALIGKTNRLCSQGV